MEAAAKPRGLTVVKAGVATSAEVQQAAQSLVGRVDDMLVLHDNTAVAAFESIVKVCDDNRIPLFSGDTDNVRRSAPGGGSASRDRVSCTAALVLSRQEKLESGTIP